MTPPTLTAEPACPATGDDVDRLPDRPRLRVEERPLAAIDRTTWDDLAARSGWSTPFSGWGFHRAWWDAYGANATELTLVVTPADAPPGAEPLAIVPLMTRHEVEPDDALTHTALRHDSGTDLTPVAPSALAIFFGASYHADYATILAAPGDLGAVAAALADHLADSPDRAPWDVVDLRRLRCGDPAADALAVAFGAREIAEGWTVNLEREDVCPVVTLPDGVDLDGYLGTLGKKERHEIRRKVRRAEAAGEVRLEDSVDPVADLDAFVDLHQKRWAADGLFPATPGGMQSRVFFRRLFELHGPDGPWRLTFLRVGDRRIAAGVHLETAGEYLYYNAGIDPEARELSPGVLLVHAFVERAVAAGVRRLDFLRGDEPYKYEWGAVDEPIQRLQVRRRND